MKVKRMVKHLFAVGAGLAMLGATAAGALAADLKDYPTQFVKDGVFNGYVVVGEKAQAIDNLAATDIATAMKYLKKAETTTTTVSGDAWKVGTSAKSYEMTDSATTVTTEHFKDIVTYISKDELQALKSGTFSTSSKDYPYNQYLYFDETTGVESGIVKYKEDDNSVTKDFLYFGNSKQIARYKLEFTSPAESAVASDLAGTAATNGQYLSSFDNTKINILGKQYTIVLATRPASGRTNSAKLTLMSGATSDTVLEGEEKTYTLDGKEYKVKLVFVDDDEAKFTVNGESTDKIQVGGTKKLSDGKELGVSEILYQSYAGGVHSASFFLGASKLVLQDDGITTGTSTYEMESGSETIDGAKVIIIGTDNNVTFKINSIELNMTTEDEYFVPANGKLSDIIAATGNDKEVLFTGNWDIEYKGIAAEKSHDLKLNSNTDRKYVLVWYDGDNNKVSMPLAYAITTADMSFGDEGTEKRAILGDNYSIAKNDYFVLTGGTATGAKAEAKSFLLQYKGADNTGKTSPKIKFKNVGSAETLEYSVATDAVAGTTPVTTIKIGGYSCQIHNASTAAADDFAIKADTDCGNEATSTGESVDIKDYYGGRIQLKFFNAAGLINSAMSNATGNTSSGIYTMTVNITTDSGNDYDDKQPLYLWVNITPTTGPELRSTTPAAYSFITPEGETDVTYGYTTIGGKVTFKSPSGAPNELTYAYPEKQALPLVYFTSGATTSTTSEGTWTAVEVVDATKLDSEITDVKAQNLIVVGGPCVNTAAAALLGNPATCTEGFAPGKARVKLFEPATGKFALLVAGYSGADTRLAGKVIAHRWKELSGTEVEVAGTTYSDATIGAPTPVAATTATG